MALLASFDVLLVGAAPRVFATLFSRFGRALGIVLEVAAAMLAALNDTFVSTFIRRRRSALR